MMSCADVLYVEEESIEEHSTEEESIVGYWFACEFGYSEPDCIIFDDDGADEFQADEEEAVDSEEDIEAHDG